MTMQQLYLLVPLAPLLARSSSACSGRKIGRARRRTGSCILGVAIVVASRRS